MQFNGRLGKITERSIEFIIDSEENKEIIMKNASRLKDNLLTIYADKEYNATFLQKRKIHELVDKISEVMEIDTELDKVYVVENYLKKKYGVENLYEGMKEETSILINGIIEFCNNNDITIYEKPIDQQEIHRLISSSNKFKTCCICGEPGETIELKSFKSKMITEFITLCANHYLDAIDTGIPFFKDHHLIITRRQS